MRFLFVDRIIKLNEGKSICGIKNITHDDAFLDNSFSKPNFYFSIVGETLGQLAAWNIMQHSDFKLRPVAGIFASIRFYRPAFVGETLFLEANIDSLQENAANYHGKAYVNGELVLSLDNALAPMLPMETFIDSTLVRDQFNQIYRPLSAHSSPTSRSHDLIADNPAIKSWERDVGKNAPPYFQFDQINSLVKNQEIIATKSISLAFAYFLDHFPKKPVLPLSVLIECTHNLTKFFMSQSDIRGFRLAEISKVKIRDFIQPGDHIICHLKLKSQDSNQLIFQATIILDDKKIGIFFLTFIKEA